MNLRRTVSGPPVAADRVPHIELPPPAKLPERAHAAPGVAADESNAPTTLALPKVSLPPLAPLPAVSAATAPPPAKPAQRLEAPKSTGAAPASAGLTALRARAARFSNQAKSYAGPLGTRLKDKRTLVVGAAIGASLAAALLAFVVLRPGGSSSEAASNLHSDTNAASPAASAHVAGAGLPQAAPDAKPARALAAPAKGSDEASVFLTLAGDYVRDHREAEAVALVSRVVLRQPELKDDARVAGVLSKTARSDAPQASDDSLALLTGPMGEKGAELMYSLALDPSLRDSVRRRVEAWLASKDFDRTSSAALYSAVKLRNAKTCDQKHALLTLAADVGGKQTLELLRDLDAHTICGASDLKNCYPCLASDSRIKDSIQRLEKRLAQ